MRLLFVTQDFPPGTGGIQRYSEALARHFGRLHEVTVVAPGGPLWSSPGGQGYRLVRLPVGHTSLFGLTTPASVPVVARATGARVAFHAHYATANGSWIAKRMGLVDDYYVAGHARELLRDNLGPLHARYRASILRGAAGVFPVSEHTKGLVLRHGVEPDRVHVVPNGVDLDAFGPRPTAELRMRLGLAGMKVMLTASRLVPRKGVDTALAALERIADDLPDLVYLVAGDGPDRPRLLRLSATLRRKGRVRFLGHVPEEDLAPLYSLADLFVMPCREERGGSVEGFGIVFLEAGACGTAVIGGRSGGVPDAVDDGVSGLLVRPDDPVELAAAIERVIRDDSLRARLSRGGLERARRFTWVASAERILEQMTRPRERPRRSAPRGAPA